MRMRMTRVIAAAGGAALMCLMAAAPAAAQSVKPKIAPIAIDLRGVYARMGPDAITASALSTTVANLPKRGLGGIGAINLYPIRGRSAALGIGGEAIFARTQHTVVDSAGKPTTTIIDRRLRGISGQVSLNFGHQAGWSYLTAGMGPLSYESYLDDATPDGLRTMTLNFGGGARWFNFDHLAFALDVRFYATKAADATFNTAPRSAARLLVFSAGISIK